MNMNIVAKIFNRSWKSLVFLLLPFLFSFGAIAQNEQPEVADQIYIVKKGDTLSEISVLLFQTARKTSALAKYNNLSNPDFILEGQKIHYRTDMTVANVETAPNKEEKDQRVDPAVGPTIDRTVAAKDPITTSDLFERGKSLFNSNEYKKALVVFSEIRETDPENSPAWFYLISSHLKLKQDKTAKALAKDLLKRHPEYASMPLLSETLKIKQPDKK